MNRLAAFFMVFFLVSGTSWGDDFERASFPFAKHLFNTGDYFRSITEAKRFIFEYPESPLKLNAEYLIGKAYSRGGDSQKAVEVFKSLLKSNYESEMSAQVLVSLGKLYGKERNYAKGSQYMQLAMLHEHAGKPTAEKAAHYYFLYSLLNGDKGVLEEGSILPRWIPTAKFESASSQYEQLEFKSPTIAGTLSAIIPGAGYYYTDRKRDALAAFILNGLFIWGAISAFENDNEGLGVAISVFEIGWYVGGIYGSANAAHKYNRRLKDDFVLGFTVDTGYYFGHNIRHKPVMVSINATF